MKVDALLSAAPKGEVRREVHFIRDSHRWASIFDRRKDVLMNLFLFTHSLLTTESQQWQS